jgi:diaminopimelate decarboxylase
MEQTQLANPPASLAEKIVANNFGARDGALVVGGVSVTELAKTYGTPLYVYDTGLMRKTYRALVDAVSGFAEVYYSIKANPNPGIARLFVEEGAGLEIASGAEYRVARAAGCDPERILFAGPGKGVAELEETIRGGIAEIHVESAEEIAHVSRIAEEIGRDVRVAIRVNPTASARGGAMQMGGRPSPFGFDEETLDSVLDRLAGCRRLHVSGVHVFSGTQILDANILEAQWAHSVGLAARVAGKLGRPLETIDLGGGLGIPYYPGDAFLDLGRIKEFVPSLRARIQDEPLLRATRVILEPGRYLTGSAGIYLMAVRSAKTSRNAHFLICDGGMHHHLAASGNLGQVVKRDYPVVAASRLDDAERFACSVVGPLCTPLDTLGRNVQMPRLEEGDLVAVLQSGAYGLTASPTGFLSHPQPAEIVVENGMHREIRSRQLG